MAGTRQHEGAIIKCLTCGKEKYYPYCRLKNGTRFCSRVCSINDPEVKRMMSEARKLNNPGGFKKGHKRNVGLKWSEERRKIRGLKWIGENNPKWKDGNGYFRKLVFERDDYICQHCGNTDKRVLVVDHVKNKKMYPNLKHEITNGMILCANCHMIKTIKDLEEIALWKKLNK